MAIRIQSRADINFGSAGAAVVVTHIRIRESDDSNPVVKQLPVAIQVANGAPMRIPSGLLDLVYPAGDFTNGHMNDIMSPYWTNKAMEIDLMTSINAVVAVTGYAQQTYSNWAISQEAD